MRPLRYSINVTLDGCCDHRAILPDEDLHRHAVENLNRADALLFGRVTYEMIDEYEFVVHPRLVGHGPTLFAGLSKRVDLKLVSRLEFGSGAVAMRYEAR
jgi:dihydrofolate reductase